MKFDRVRTRFAPSPTGYLHIGGLRTALYSYLYAKKHNGDFLLRIEDTDQTRYVEGSVENLIASLQWAGIDYDEGPNKDGGVGPYFQSERTEIYRKYAQELLAKGQAYYCFHTPEELDAQREILRLKKLPPRIKSEYRDMSLEEARAKVEAGEKHVVRLRVPEGEDVTFTDEVRGKVTINTREIDDQVLMKADGFPTYHLANVVDDHLMRITHVIRGEEWLPSTPKHILLYRAFGWDAPIFAHLPLLLNKNKAKLSKRHNDVAVEDYMQKGYLKEGLVNYVALLGWAPRDDKEIMTLDEMVSEFSLAKVNKSGAVFDVEKLNWMNGKYVRDLPAEELLVYCKPYLEEAGYDLSDNQYVLGLLSLEQERMKFFSEITDSVGFYFADTLSYDAEMLMWRKADLAEAKERLTQVVEYLNSYTGEWSLEALETAMKSWIQEGDLGMGNTLWPLRVALSGQERSPSPFELLSVMGKERSLGRINHALELLG